MKRTLAALFVLVALAAAARLHWFTGLVIGDDVVYSDLAVRFLHGEQRITNVHSARVGFFLPLCASYALFGPGEIPLVLYNLLCSLGSVVLAFLLGRRLFSDAAGLFAAAIVALHPLLVTYSTECHTDPALSFWTALAMYVFLRAERRGQLALAGILFGWCYLTKEATIALVPFFVGHWIVTKRRWMWYLPLALAAASVVVAEGVLYAISHGDPFHRYAMIRTQHAETYLSKHYTSVGSILYRVFAELPGRLFVPWKRGQEHTILHLAAIAAAVACRKLPGIRFLAGWFGSIFVVYALLPSSLSPFVPGFFLYEWTLQVFVIPMACVLGAALRRWWMVLPIAALSVYGNVVRAPEFRRYAAGPKEAYERLKGERGPIVMDYKTLETFVFLDGHKPTRTYLSYEGGGPFPPGVVVVDEFWIRPGQWWSRGAPPEVRQPPPHWRKEFESPRLTIYRIGSP